MSRLLSGLLVVAAISLSGCAAMERNHYMPAFSEVPVKIKLAFSEKYPTDAIQINQTVAQTMFDGTVHYRLTVLNSKNVSREVVYTADGQEL